MASTAPSKNDDTRAGGPTLRKNDASNLASLFRDDQSHSATQHYFGDRACQAMQRPSLMQVCVEHSWGCLLLVLLMVQILLCALFAPFYWLAENHHLDLWDAFNLSIQVRTQPGAHARTHPEVSWEAATSLGG